MHMFQSFLVSYERFVHIVNNISVKAAGILLLFMMSLTFFDVLGRELYRPILGAHELTYLALAVFIFFSLGYTEQKKGHISIDFLVEKLPERAQVWLSFVIYLITFMLLTLMTWKTFSFSIQLSTTETGELGMPVSMFVMLCGIGLILYVLTVLLGLLKTIKEVVGTHES